MVDREAGPADGSAVPTIAQLLTAYRDRTGASYEEMARKVGDEINRSTMHKLATEPPKQFPKLPRTVERLADLLEVPVTTIVLAFAAGLGLDVKTSQSRLALLLPPSTDLLTEKERDAILGMVRSMMEARMQVRWVTSYGDRGIGFQPLTEEQQADFGLAARRGPSEGRRLREQQDTDTES